MATAIVPSIYTLGMGGLLPEQLSLLTRIVSPAMALDIRPKANHDSEVWVGRYLRWGGHAEDSHYVPDLHEWRDHPDALRRLVATARKKGSVLIVCTCDGECARHSVAERATYFIPDLPVTDLDFLRPALDPDVRADMAPDAVERLIHERDEITARMAHPDVQAARTAAISAMTEGLTYTVRSVSDTLRKRSATGAYRGQNRGSLLLRDAAGRVQRFPIERITAIEDAIEEPVEEIAA